MALPNNSFGKTEKTSGRLNEDGSNPQHSQRNENPEDVIKTAAKVVERAAWGAHNPNSLKRLKTPVNKVVLTWTETEQCMTEQECVRTVKDIQKAHLKEKGISDIKHNFLLGSDGVLYEGRGFTQVGPTYTPEVDEKYALTGKSIQIAFIDKCKNKPSPILLKVLSECLSFGVNGEIIDPKFTLFWMSAEDVIHIQPTMLK